MATTPNPAATSLAVDATIWLGQNLVRRVAAKTANVYLGENTNAQELLIPVGVNSLVTTFAEPSSMMVLRVSAPISVQLDMGTSQPTLAVNQLMMLDCGILSILFSNAGTFPVTAQLVSVT